MQPCEARAQRQPQLPLKLSTSIVVPWCRSGWQEITRARGIEVPAGSVCVRNSPEAFARQAARSSLASIYIRFDWQATGPFEKPSHRIAWTLARLATSGPQTSSAAASLWQTRFKQEATLVSRMAVIRSRDLSSPASPTTSCAASSCGDSMGIANVPNATAAEDQVKPEPAHFAFAAGESELIGRKSHGSAVFQPYKSSSLVRLEGDEASSSHKSWEDEASPMSAISPPFFATVSSRSVLIKTELPDYASAHDRDQTFDMLTIILTATSGHNLKTAALNQLLHLCAISPAAQEVIGDHEGLHELLLLHTSGSFIHSYLASAVLRQYAGSSWEAHMHLQRLSIVLCSSQELTSDLVHLSQRDWIAIVRSCNLLCAALQDFSCVHIMLKSGCMAPLILLLRSISSTTFHFEASFEASAGAGRVIAAAIRLLLVAAAFSEEASSSFVQAGLITMLLENPAAFNGPDAEPIAADQLLRQLLSKSSSYQYYLHHLAFMHNASEGSNPSSSRLKHGQWEGCSPVSAGCQYEAT
ncbi:hypothetical protein WJX74_000438 [Apatococcus lobatus]|uniref:Wings apart-like protein C-terminal domain-containing protein n=1 Tax=Apatococcus lobatus TaxID=904363 RepID=A0AAW1Q992_9CHLO